MLGKFRWTIDNYSNENNHYELDNENNRNSNKDNVTHKCDENIKRRLIMICTINENGVMTMIYLNW